MPDPTKIRLAQPDDAAAIARVHVESWRTTYRGIMPEQFLASLSAEQREAFWRQHLPSTGNNVILVAENDLGEIVGFAAGSAQLDDDPIYPGRVHAIYLLQSAQRKGLGRALFTALITKLAAHGMTSFRLEVVAENPARNFYEAMGGKVIGEKSEEIGGVPIQEIVYGWEKIPMSLQP